MSKEKLRFAVIGCGRMGRRRIKTIIQHPNAELICVADSDNNTANVALENGAKHFNSFKEAIARDDVDCVMISTPNKFHSLIAIEALKKKKHVSCEKPLARNPHEALMMTRAALKNGVFLKTCSNLRYFPSVLKAKELLVDKAIGEILYLRGWIGNEGWHLNHSWFSDPELSGGGTFLDNGCHLLDITRWFIGEVSECMGYVTTTHWPVGPLEDNGFGIFKTVNGKLASIQSSWTEWAGYMYMEIYGKEGYICVENRKMLCKTTLGKKDGAQYVFDYSLQPPVSYKLEMQDLISSIQEDRQPLPSGFDGLRAVQMAYGVYESAKTGRAVNIYGKNEERLSKLIDNC